MSEQSIQAERLALATEYLELVTAGARHQSHLHETDAAKVDNGSSRFCLGCRALLVAKRSAELEASLDDVQPQAQFEGKSRLEVVTEELVKRREIEAVVVEPRVR